MIRKFIYTACISIYSTIGFAQAKVEFENKTIDFGKVVEGSICKHRFIYKNIGLEPFIISHVSVTCGCTAPFWSKTPLLPGDTASIYIEFNTHNKMGNVAKGVNLMTNCAEPLIGLIILANIVPDSTFVPTIDSLSAKPLKLVFLKSFCQVNIPLKSLTKSGFKGNAADGEKIIKRILKDNNQLLYDQIWFTQEKGMIVTNMMDKNLQAPLITLIKKELLNKKRLKYWVKKVNEG